MGNVFQNRDTEIVSQGSNDSTVIQQRLSVDIADPTLVSELASIKARLLQTASTGADYESVAGIQSAIEAAERKDERAVVKFLKKAGSKALEVGLDIGTKVAVKALEYAAG